MGFSHDDFAYQPLLKTSHDIIWPVYAVFFVDMEISQTMNVVHVMHTIAFAHIIASASVWDMNEPASGFCLLRDEVEFIGLNFTNFSA